MESVRSYIQGVEEVDILYAWKAEKKLVPPGGILVFRG